MSDPRHTPPELARFNQHFAECIVPLWQGPGWNADLALPYEALDAKHQPLPAQRYRAMACARQLYLFSSRIGQPGAAERAAALFRSLQKHFHDAEHGGWFYSIDAQGKPLDRRKDLYTHAFIVFACAHYWGKVRESLVESTLNAALDIIDQQFARDDGLYEASLGEDWADLGSGPLQNPQMHLAEAFLQVLAVRADEHTQQSLLQLCEALQAHFVEPAHGLMLEKPRGAVDNWFEPGHQFEWFYLLHTSPLLRDTPLHASIVRAFGFAEQYGVKREQYWRCWMWMGGCWMPRNASGHRRSTCGRWYYARGVEAKLVDQLQALQARFLREAGWYECRDGEGNVSRHDMPSTTPYHLATCLEGLQRLN